MSAFLWDIWIIIFGIVIAWVIFGIVFRMVPSIIWFITVVWMMIFVIIVFRGRSALFFRFLFRFFTFRTFWISFWPFSGSRQSSTIQDVRRQGHRTTGHLLDFQLYLEKFYNKRVLLGSKSKSNLGWFCLNLGHLGHLRSFKVTQSQKNGHN